MHKFGVGAWFGMTLVMAACGGSVTPLEPDPRVDAGRDQPIGLRDAGSSPEASSPALLDAAPTTVTPVTPPVDTNDGLGSACLRAPAMAPATQAHVIGVYEPTGAPHGAGGAPAAAPIDVRVTVAASPATLFLSSYEPVAWRLTVDPGASVKKVFVSSFYPQVTTVQGAGSAPVVALGTGAAGCAYGFEAADSDGGCPYTKTIGVARSSFGGLETTFQGSYSASAFTVPSATTAPHAHYDNTAPCVGACTRSSSGAVAWSVASPGTVATTNGLSATVTRSTWGAELRAAPGVRCGRHYFEIEATGATAVVGASVSDVGAWSGPRYGVPSARVTNGRVGVALDLDAGTIRFVDASGAGAASDLGLWDHEEVVPVVSLEREVGAVVKIATRAPFVFTPPAGFAADL